MYDRLGWKVAAKRELRAIRRSQMPVRDCAQLAFALVFRRSGHLVASTVRYRIAGEVNRDGPFYFGVLCNRLFHAPGDRGSLKVAEGGTLTVGRDVRVAASARVSVRGELTIGNNVRINHGAQVLASNSVTIGDGVAIGPGCMILDSDLHGLTIDGVPRPMTAPVVIGDRVWIGARCTLLKGASVGDGSIIAAGSVVSGSIPSGVVAGGTPARVLATDASWTP